MKKINIFIEKINEKIEKNVDENSTFEELLKELNLKKETSIIMANNKIIVEKEKINNYKDIQILYTGSRG